MRPVTPLLAVDLVIEHVMKRGKIVLIERKNSPLGWALPGGFVNVGESVEHAAIREAREETSLKILPASLRLIGVYSDPLRDPRGHTVSIAFSAEGQGGLCGRDDAKKAKLFHLWKLPDPICFDHIKIIADWKYLREMRVKET